MYYIYMIRCKDNSIYTGITTDIKRRWEEHLNQNQNCAKYTLSHPVEKIEIVWQTTTKVLASKLEFQIKKLNKTKKEKLIKNKKIENFLSDKLECQNYEVFKYKEEA